MKEANHRGFLDSQDGAICKRGGRGHSQWLSGEATLTEKLLRIEHGDYGFFRLLRDNGDFDLSVLDVVHRVSGVPLGKNNMAAANSQHRLAVLQFGKKGPGVENRRELRSHKQSACV